jgi:translation initiation factor IF-2
MAKIRIYELARDLNMDNKELLEKLNEMKVSVKSHMSSIDEKTAEKLIASVREVKKDSSVEETRVTTTVIRRRRKAEQEKPVKEVQVKNEEKEKTAEARKEKKEAVSEFVEIVEIVENKAPAERIVEDKKEEPKEDKEASEEVKDKKEEQQSEEKPKPKKRKRRRKKKKDIPAKIIKLPDFPLENIAKTNADKKNQEIKKDITHRKEHKKAPVDKIDKIDKVDKMTDEKEAAAKRKKTFEEDEKKRIKIKQAAQKRKSSKVTWRKKIVEGSDIYSKGTSSRYYKSRKKKHKGKQTQVTIPKAIKRKLKIDESIVVADLAKRMGIKASDIIKKLINMGVMATINNNIDFETAIIIAAEFNFEVEKASFEEEEILKINHADSENMMPRPPIITIMGHVDHGKTSLLDVIRETKVTDTESGGITQHIGAYNVKIANGQITFLDTPGHEAFTSMRARGASVTDIVVLVVAADDGVMPQTIEAINHSKAGNVPIIVAINKIDKPDAKPENVTRQLAEYGLVPESWGGDTIFVNVSAKKQKGIDELLEMILLQAEMLELKANPDSYAKGYVIEAKLDSAKGTVATVIIQNGSLKVGNALVCGIHHGKIRAMMDDTGKKIKKAGPSMPVEILGLSGVPDAGDELIAVEDEKSAKQVSIYRSQKQRSQILTSSTRMSLESLFEKMSKGEVKDLNLIIKTDVQGSIEALKEALSKLSMDEVNINIIHSATGAVTESDISLAAVSDAIILGFNIRPSASISSIAEKEDVDMRFYNIIYDAIDDIKAAVQGMIKPTFKEKIIGRAEIRQVFTVPKIGAIAGSYVTDGKIERGKKVRILRDSVIQYEGQISSLKRFKDDVKEVLTNYECGIGIEHYNDIKIGDIIQCYYMEEVIHDREADKRE